MQRRNTLLIILLAFTNTCFSQLDISMGVGYNYPKSITAISSIGGEINLNSGNAIRISADVNAALSGSNNIPNSFGGSLGYHFSYFTPFVNYMYHKYSYDNYNPKEKWYIGGGVRISDRFKDNYHAFATVGYNRTVFANVGFCLVFDDSEED